MNRTPLDPKRVENAERRIATALRNAAYHDKQAAAQRATAATIARTWGIELPPAE